MAEANFRDAVRAKDNALRGVALDLSVAQRTALASGATASQLASIGMARPAKPVRPTALAAPASLVVGEIPDSRIRIAFDRNGNPQGTTFEIWGSADGVNYALADTTTRASLSLEGYAPGAAAWFKIRARRAGLASAFSNIATAYAPGGSAKVQLKLAA